MQTLRERQTDLSIIIPVYNLEHYIEPMLHSLLAQETGDYTTEIIFVLNNCTDRSEDVIRNSGLDCQILYCEPQGCGCARNVGFDAAVGEFVWFMDGDDWLLSSMAIRTVLDKVKGLDIIRVPFKSERYIYGYFSMVWQYVMRRDFIKSFRFPDYQPSEDDAYMESVLNKAGFNRYTYMSLPQVVRPLYYYNYLREGSNMYRVTVLGEQI